MFKILALFVTVVPVFIDSQGCPRCSFERNEVCSIDQNHKGANKTHINDCLRLTENCDSGTNYTVIHKERCRGEDCRFKCPKTCKPVCGTSNDNTFRNFTNKCCYELANCDFRYNKPWYISSESACPGNVCPDCSDYTYAPVCYSITENGASRNKTYLNDCKAKQDMYCNKRGNSEQPSLRKISSGPCYQPKLCPKCLLTKGEEICCYNGTQFRTFINSCVLLGSNECSDKPKGEKKYYEAYEGNCTRVKNGCTSQSQY